MPLFSSPGPRSARISSSSPRCWPGRSRRRTCRGSSGPGRKKTKKFDFSLFRSWNGDSCCCADVEVVSLGCINKKNSLSNVLLHELLLHTKQYFFLKKRMLFYLGTHDVRVVLAVLIPSRSAVCRDDHPLVRRPLGARDVLAPVPGVVQAVLVVVVGDVAAEDLQFMWNR